MDTGQTNVTRLKLSLVAFVCLSFGAVLFWTGERVVLGVWLRATKEYREKIQLRTIGKALPFAILEEIHDAGEDVPSILALIMCESSGNPMAQVKDAKGNIIAKGLMGISPRHATDRGYSVEDLANPVLNVRIGIEVLKEIRTRWPKELDAVSSWNCGEVAWKRVIDTKTKPPTETQSHWRRFQEFRDSYRKYVETGEGLE